MEVEYINFMEEKTGENILKTFRQYGLSFLFLNAIAALFVYLVFPMLSNKHNVPIEVCFSCGGHQYFINIGYEFILLIVGSALGLLASIGLIKLIETFEIEFIFKFFSNPLVHIILMFNPVYVFFNQLDKGNILIYDGTIDKTLERFYPYLIFIIFNYSFLLLLHERGKYSKHPREFQPLLLLSRKAPHFINYMILSAVLLNLPFSGRFFIRDALCALNLQIDGTGQGIIPITLQKGIFLFSSFSTLPLKGLPKDKCR